MPSMTWKDIETSELSEKDKRFLKFGDLFDDDVVLCNRSCYSGGVGLLEGVPADKLCTNLTRQSDDGYRIHHSCSQSGNDVSCTGSGGCNDYTNFPGCAGVCICHVASALFVAGDDEINRCIVELVEERQDDAAKVAEHYIDALFDERINDNLTAGFFGWGGFVSLFGIGFHNFFLPDKRYRYSGFSWFFWAIPRRRFF